MVNAGDIVFFVVVQAAMAATRSAGHARGDALVVSNSTRSRVLGRGLGALPPVSATSSRCLGWRFARLGGREVGQRLAFVNAAGLVAGYFFFGFDEERLRTVIFPVPVGVAWRRTRSAVGSGGQRGPSDSPASPAIETALSPCMDPADLDLRRLSGRRFSRVSVRGATLSP